MPGKETLLGFAPVWNKDIRILVLGSMPSALSLERGQHFANPRNAFWPIAFDSFAQPMETEYGARLRFLLERGIGLWDAAASCQRRGSLDSAMRQVRLNDFAPLFAACPALKTVLCNGSKAFALFARAVRGRDLGARALCLPSTSPALASLSYGQKLAAWAPYLREER